MKPLFAAALVLSAASSAVAQPPPLGNPPAPAANQITENKRVLGKILFWEEQLSSSGTVSCGTCHTPDAGGGDARRAVNRGPDGVLNTQDDIFASPGVIGSNADNDYQSVPGFAFASQVTARATPSAFMGAFFTQNFWDGRVGPSFVSPTTGQTVLNANAALEAQSVGPPLSTSEMAHDNRSWTQITEKLRTARPLALVDQVPSDVAAALADGPSYPALFLRAFGSGAVTAERIAQAIATYERTLVPNQTPWDRFTAGQQNALTPQQVQGLNVFTGPAAHCNACHGGSTFSDNAFHNIGLRPVAEDPGRQSVTGNVNDRGKFRTPSLRNVGLRNSFFHNGRITTLEDVIRFYAQAPGSPIQFLDNLDPAAANINVNPQQLVQLADFLRNGLTDPRVAASTFPFDKPRLWTLRQELRPSSLGGGSPPAGSPTVPLTIASDPPLIGTSGFRIGLGNAPAGRSAALRVSFTPPAAGVVSGGETLPAATVGAAGAVTVRMDIAPDKFQPGVPAFLQWEVAGADGAGVAARSDAVRIVPFCARGGCPSSCVADVGSQGGGRTPDGHLDNNDFVAFIDLFFSLSGAADIGRQGGVSGADGAWDNNDFVVFVDEFFGGC
ncbi:MAG TPA: cytochrome c peroxidase [Phycisphaerales bacterium]|nr:cytochrome c peroxidase [Phycisphaerales bacterium]